MARKYVLTGGPCSGKTSLLNALRKKGYKVINESSKLLIAKEFAKDAPPLWTYDFLGFQKKLLDMQIQQEREISMEERVIIDRGIIDTIAYFKVYKKKASPEILNIAEKNRYDGIFFLDLLQNYKQSFIRRESFEESKRIHDILKKSYQDFGYNLIQIPECSLEIRADLIINKLNKDNFRPILNKKFFQNSI